MLKEIFPAPRRLFPDHASILESQSQLLTSHSFSSFSLTLWLGGYELLANMDWFTVNVLLLSLIGPLLAVRSAKQSSTWEDLDASLTLDQNTSSCAKTGYHTYSWYVQDTGAETTVNKVIINGIGLKNIFITVGDNAVSSGSFRGFSGNHDCNVVKTKIGDNINQEITCFVPVTGRYITLEALNEEDLPHQLEICEFSFEAL